jgi:hypothetical protein
MSSTPKPMTFDELENHLKSRVSPNPGNSKGGSKKRKKRKYKHRKRAKKTLKNNIR